MRAVRDLRSGGPEVLEVTEVAEPELTPGGVLIEVTAAGLNRADVLQRQGHYPVPEDATDVFGLEVSGTVLELGQEVPETLGFAVGDRVVALVDSGGYAERAVAPWEQVLPLPEGVDPVAAAGLPEVAATVFSNVFMAAAAREWESTASWSWSSRLMPHFLATFSAVLPMWPAPNGSVSVLVMVSRICVSPIRAPVRMVVDR